MSRETSGGNAAVKWSRPRPSSPTEAWWRSRNSRRPVGGHSARGDYPYLAAHRDPYDGSNQIPGSGRTLSASSISRAWPSVGTVKQLQPRWGRRLGRPSPGNQDHRKFADHGVWNDLPTHVRHAFLALHGRWQQDHVDQAGFGANIRALRASATPTETDPSYTRESTVASRSAE